MSHHYPFELQPLPYPYDALEPHIDMETLHFHHDKHLKTYVDNLNKALEPYGEYHSRSLEELLTHYKDLPDELQPAVKNNGGGVYNHQLYFSLLTPEKTEPSGRLAEELDRTFGGFEEFQQQFSEMAMKVFGSGYTWLVKDERDRLAIVSYPNQDTPLPHGLKPVLLSDVWEHAYYLKNQNRRADYIRNWFQVLNWDQAAKNYELGLE